MSHRGLKFGIFLAPFHRVGENPTLSMDRDMELIEWMDHLGYDEVWVGEHHSAGWETIASPEIFIAAAAQRTRHIMLGSGVTSLPYHHPLMVANRFVQLDHMTRGRTMLGCGPGALPSDAYMMGIEPVTQRPRMDEALDAIMRLLRGDEPVTMKTDWFELREARLHLAPYTDPHFPIAVASTITPFGVMSAAKHGLGVLSIGAGLPGGPEALAGQWKIGEETAAKYGQTMDRKKWRVVVNTHVAEDDEQALRDVAKGERRETVTYFEETLGRPPGRSDDPSARGREDGHHPRGLAGDGDPRHPAAAGVQRRRVRRRPVPGARVGQSRADAPLIRALRALRDAVLPGLAQDRRGLQRVGPVEPQIDLRPQRGGGPPRLRRRRARGPRRIPRSNGRRARHPGRTEIAASAGAA
jgi:limonene 1,2-monooxygenase